MRRWGRSVAFVVAAVALSAAQHPNPSAEPKKAEAQQSIATAKQQIATANDDAAERTHRAKYEAQCKRGDDKRESDLCAQWKAADAAADAAWWTARETLVSAISGLLVIFALCFAFEANRIARDTAKRELRAYLCLRPVVIQKIVQDTQPIHVVVPVENAGQTPANKWFNEWAWLVSSDEATSEMFDETLAKYADEVTRQASIGPHQFKEVPYWLPIGPDWRTKILAGDATLYVMGRVHYEDVFGASHVTEFFYYYTENLPNRLAQTGVHNNIG